MVEETKPDCVFIGVPPIVHGSMSAGGRSGGRV
jgi:hypothetical protein